jgi:hypothetical protein
MFIATEYVNVESFDYIYDVKTEGKGGRAQTLKGHACMFVHTALQVPTKSAQEYVAPIGRIEEHYSLVAHWKARPCLTFPRLAPSQHTLSPMVGRAVCDRYPYTVRSTTS